MGEKIILCIATTLLIFLIPYGLTRVLDDSKKVDSKPKKSHIMVNFNKDGKEQELDLEEYIEGVLMSSVPSDYEETTYQAMAIVLRTSGYKMMKLSGSVKGEDLSGEYLSQKELEAKIGKKRAKETLIKIRNAISSTGNQVLLYDGDYIDALYHNVSIGKTAEAKDVYNQDIPYLVSVDSSADVESEDYMQSFELSYEQIVEKLEPEGSESKLHLTKEHFQKEIAISKKSTDGYVQSVKLGKETMTGEEFRSKIGLHSLYYYIEPHGEKLRFTAIGMGHGLGLSLYGANEMAKEGSDYKEILLHYYTGVKIMK